MIIHVAHPFVQERLDLLPNLLHGLQSNFAESPTHAASLFNLCLRLLHSMTFPPRGNKEDLDLRRKLGLTDRKDDAIFVADWLGKLFLLGSSQQDTTRCPGLSTKDCGFLQLYGKKDTWTPTALGGLNLVETKVAAAKFLASGAFVDSERFLPALFASADPNLRLSDIGDDILKRTMSAVSFEDTVLVQQLFEIYLGTRGTEGSLPARIPLQTKILSLLCRSKLASSFVSQSTQIINEGLAPEDTTSQIEAVSRPRQGLEASRLRSQIFAFTNWLARISTSADISAFAPALVSRLRAYIENQGWPRYNADSAAPSAGDLSSRAYGYESIGILAGSCPEQLLLEPELDLLRWLFKSLSEDPSGKDISISIEQALSSVLGGIGHELDPKVESALTTLLLHHINLRPGGLGDADRDVVRSTSFVAVRFSNRCLPYDNANGRWIDVLALEADATVGGEVFEEGRKGLDPYWYRMLNPVKEDTTSTGSSLEITRQKFPAYTALIKKFFGSDSAWNTARVQKHHVSRAYFTALDFCRNVLFHQALVSIGSPPVVDTDWERNIDALVANDESARTKLRIYFLEFSAKNQVFLRAQKTYLEASYFGMTAEASGGTGKAGKCILELCSLIPSSVYRDLSARIFDLEHAIYSTNKLTRATASRLFGLLASLKECPEDESQMMLRSFSGKIQSWRQAVGGEVLQIHGAILATAYFLSRSLSRGNLPHNFSTMGTNIVSTLLDISKDCRDPMLLDAGFIAIADLALFSVLTPTILPESYDVRILVRKLTEKAKNGEEKAILALGHLAIQFSEDESEDSTLSHIIKELYKLHEVRQADVQFAVGAAICCAAVGWRSKSLISASDIQCSHITSSSRERTLSTVLDKVLSDCKTTKPVLRQASVIWLLCLVQYCGHLEEIQSHLRECQVAFKGFLADRDSLNQESASRGLTLVYEKGNDALKSDLIRDLVGSFTGSSAGLAGNVSEETELFDLGALPTGDGSVTTYKDIMSLASEVGNSSLVYKFMSLASSNAIWSSRAAFGRFGLSNILSDASTDGYLAQNPKLYPALFRYRFDPNTNVRSSMNDIWAALVKEPAKTIDEHFDEIMSDLLRNILGKEWRVRQASCAAIADLVQGRPLEKYEKYLSKIWELAFKVCDDIKESVRAAAMALARVLTGILTRGLEAGEPSTGSVDKMLKQVLPFLLSPSGLESGAPDIQDFARKTLLKIIKSSNGNTLRPFVPGLVGRFLALLSSIEPEMINYLHLNAEKYGLTAQQLDDARLKHIRGSSMLEAIERCLDYLNEASMPELQQSLENAIKTVVGLPSRVGCSRVLVSLSTRQNYIFKPYADHFLLLARKQVYDRNDTISSSYAAACGYLARLASDNAVLKLVAYSQKLYFDSDDDKHRVIAGDIVYAVSKHATDRFKSIAGEILPFVFVAKHDIHDRVKSLFRDTWSENVGGSRAVLLYLKEIIEIASQHLESARWSIKHTSAFAIADLVESTGSSIDDTKARLIWPPLEKALSGKTWEGKETVLKALIQLIKNSGFWLGDLKIVEQLEKIVLRESKRNNPNFRQHALGCLRDFAELRETVDMYPKILAVTKPIIEDLLGTSEEMDVDSQSGGPSSKSVNEATLANALMALLYSINPRERTGSDLNSSLEETLRLVKRVRAENGSKIILNAIYEAQKPLYEKLHNSINGAFPESLENVLIGYIQVLFASSDLIEQTRLKAAEATITMAPIAKTKERLSTTFVQEMMATRAQERSAQIQQILDRARALLDD